ncbi:MAG: hypothetical protein R6U89_10810, partial [Dehalococcoidia bacterium]
MEFKSVRKYARLRPAPGFHPETQEIEYRYDPLLGSTTIINARRAERARQAETTTALSDKITRETKEGCPFCPEQIEEKAPLFPEEISPEGRFRQGECIVFPNLFAFAEYHAVGTFSRTHFLYLDQFSTEMLVNNMTASQKWMLSVRAVDENVVYPVYMWNHLPPSGGSIIHPHCQIMMRQMPTSMQARLISRSSGYFKEKDRNYWQELIRREKEIGERFIAEYDSLAIIASYAPRGFREIQFIFREVSTFTDLDEAQLNEFAEAILKVLLGYRKMGVGSFNIITFSGPAGKRLEYYCLNAKIISRPFPQGVYTSDTGTLERLQDEWVIETLPEDVASRMRSF